MRIENNMDLGGASRVAREAALRGLLLGGEMVGEESDEQVPMEDGDLRRTRAVTGDPATLRVAVSYRDVAYKGQAVDQHENMTYRHDSGRNAKYLERAMASRKSAVLDAVAGQLRRAFGG